MKNPIPEFDNDPILHTLQQNWESAVSTGLRRLSDDDLLRLLSEVSAHTEDTDELIDEAFADAPNWDDRTPAELDAIAWQFEQQITAGGTSSSATPVRAPLRRRTRSSPAQLSFEELESRFSPSPFTVIAHGRAAFAPTSAARWAIADERVPAVASESVSPAPRAWGGEAVNHLLFDFDAEALGHMALAQVA